MPIYMRLTGHQALAHARITGKPLSKYASATEGARAKLDHDTASRYAAQNPGLIFLDLPWIQSLDLYEEEDGTLWLVSEDEGLAVKMDSSGDFLADCRAYRREWVPEECNREVQPAGGGSGILNRGERSRFVATYRVKEGSLHLHWKTEDLRPAARGYLSWG